jgi:acyl carrier protein
MAGYETLLRELLVILRPFAKPGQTLQEETDLMADLGLDSLRVMKLVVEVEDRFDISIPINMLPNIRTIKDFAEQLEQLVGEGQ